MNTLKTEGVDHSQKQATTAPIKGTSRKLGAQPWKKSPERKLRASMQRGKMFGKDNPSRREANGKRMMKRNSPLSKKQEVKPFKKPNNLQQMGEDF